MRPVRIARILSTTALMLAASTLAFAQADAHSGHGQGERVDPAAAAPSRPGTAESEQELPPFIPRLTDEDRKAAFPDLHEHAPHGNSINYFVLFDRLEWQGGAGHDLLRLDSRGWVGRDRDRLWVRAEGEGEAGHVGEAEAHILYGRQFSRWWDVVAGVREDFGTGPGRTWAAIGVQGLAPYWFEVEATAYVGAAGRTQARFEVEYELLLTNRWIAQPVLEAEIFGKSDPERGVGAGLSTTEAGVRLRYELKRELAPYVGIGWSRKWGKTADFGRAAGDRTSGARFVTGVRLWF